MANPDFWRAKRVLLTGHTGFKGGWLATWLSAMGAHVTGFALQSPPGPSLFEIAGYSGSLSIIGDLRDREDVGRAVGMAAPDIVLHLAAQPLVRASYADPVGTFGTNLMGTVHLLDAVRLWGSPVILIVTTDKVYQNDGSGRAFREDDRLGGHDPYAASKAAVEIAVSSFRQSYFDSGRTMLVTARGGNVIGGGDFAVDRLVPDIVRSISNNALLTLRNPGATRPWQHVLDCLDGYLTYVEALCDRAHVPTEMNIGPHDPADTMTVEALTAELCDALGAAREWKLEGDEQPHEMAALALEPSRAREVLGWQGRLTSREAIRLTADWYGAWNNGADMARFTRDQIAAYTEMAA